ncbi:hypothetical protein [Nonomuraea mesophila]|uniref:hypothetical protein n=1 Tax=Nonomuraea mesophila TaxID=2530382 RepID=UPI00140D56AB|nr:hypothetical protein [Nonomuraea mesophila]
MIKRRTAQGGRPDAGAGLAERPQERKARAPMADQTEHTLQFPGDVHWYDLPDDEAELAAVVELRELGGFAELDEQDGWRAR